MQEIPAKNMASGVKSDTTFAMLLPIPKITTIDMGTANNPAETNNTEANTAVKKRKNTITNNKNLINLIACIIHSLCRHGEQSQQCQ